MTINTHHSDEDLAKALELARRSWETAKAISTAAQPRRFVKQVAVKDWQGPHRDRFVNVFEIEETTAQTASNQMRTLAAASAQYWMDAINARTNRIYDEAMEAFTQTAEWGLPNEIDRPSRGTIHHVAPSPPHYQPRTGADQ